MTWDTLLVEALIMFVEPSAYKPLIIVTDWCVKSHDTHIHIYDQARSTRAHTWLCTHMRTHTHTHARANALIVLTRPCRQEQRGAEGRARRERSCDLYYIMLYDSVLYCSMCTIVVYDHLASKHGTSARAYVRARCANTCNVWPRPGTTCNSVYMYSCIV